MRKVHSLNELPSVQAYLTRIGAEARSLRSAVVKEHVGKYWRDVTVIKFKDGQVIANSLEYAPTELERAAIAAEWATVSWPQPKLLSRIVNPPPMMKAAEPKDVFEFRDTHGKIVMVQVRVERDGDKAYVPWTYFDDDQWRCCEPDGPLPLFNADKLAGAATVFIHEGAKAARRVQAMTEAKTVEERKRLKEHPWGQELTGAVHVGWIGGALNPYRTDWSVLAKAGVKRAYIVADNDEPGRAAVPSIARQLRMATFSVQFTNEWPVSFDLADEFPTSMFSEMDGVRYYVGPQFRDCLHPATWATDVEPNPAGKGRPIHVLRDSCRQMWAYVEEADVFVCTEMPEIIRSESILNKMLAPFSHTQETSRLIVKAYRGRSARICYRPDHAGLMVTFRGSSAVNLHVPTTIRSAPGDPGPWLRFLDYMFPNPRERKEVERWCATLIARPDIRMGYGLLLVSERQGVGKTTLGAHILAPLVGPQNVGYPSEGDIGGAFNDWVAHKRLVIVNEIYSGQSWKAYNSLKSVITDRDVTVNQKYMRQYTIENWCHVLACSNSMRALKMENDDRRWFYPEVTEVPWNREQFVEFRRWIESGGLSIIKHWADGYGDYVQPADRAPMTERKRELIEGSRSEAQREAAALAEVLKDMGRPGVMLIKDVVGWVRQSVQGRVFESDYELRKVMVECGLHCWQKRLKIAGRLQYALMNDQMMRLVQGSDDATAAAMLRDAIVQPVDIMETAM